MQVSPIFLVNFLIDIELCIYVSPLTDSLFTVSSSVQPANDTITNRRQLILHSALATFAFPNALPLNALAGTTFFFFFILSISHMPINYNYNATRVAVSFVIQFPFLLKLWPEPQIQKSKFVSTLMM